MPSRRLLLATVALPMAAALAGCGFELRRAPELHFQRIQLAASGRARRSPTSCA